MLQRNMYSQSSIPHPDGPGVAPMAAQSVVSPLSFKDENLVLQLRANASGVAHASAISAGPRVRQGRRKNGKRAPKGLVFPVPLGSSIMDNSVYRVCQSLSLPSFVSSTTLTGYAQYAFQFSQLDQSGSLSTVFDQYRIAMIEWTALPRLNVNDQAAVNTGTLATVVDYDDMTALTSFAQALDYSNVLQTEGYREHKHTFVPHIAVAAFSGTFTSYANEVAPWIDCASNTVQHYGIKLAWTATSAVLTYDVRARCIFEFRNVR